jgi:hypothetical protein
MYLKIILIVVIMFLLSFVVRLIIIIKNIYFFSSGQQVDSNGGFILVDSILTSEHLQNLFEDNSTYIIQDLQIILPFISHQWTRLLKQKYIKNIEIDDLSKEINENNSFGNKFYEQLVQILTKNSINFDIYTKLIPRDSSGTSKNKK